MFTPEGADKLKESGYMKFVEGANKFRIMREPVVGFEYWLDVGGNIVPKNKTAGKGGKAVRVREFDELEIEQRVGAKAFAATVVWNYNLKKIQILQIKQSSIMSSLDVLSSSEDWGDIMSYDITVTKTKTGPDTQDVDYAVMPSPKKDISEEVLNAYNITKINIKAWLEGKDPFDINVVLSDEELESMSKTINA